MPKGSPTSFFLFFLLIALNGCESSIRRYYESIYTPELYSGSGYDLSSPDSVLTLPAQLDEISGLGYINDTALAAIQDEKGKMFVINVTNGTIVKEIEFAKNGDFEGIELVDNTVLAIKSNGKIYRFRYDPVKTEVESEEIENEFKSKNDIEGIAFDRANNRLLIVCKGNGEVDDNNAKGKCMYAMDPRTMILEKKPVQSIQKSEISRIIEKQFSDLKLNDRIGPSGIAVHPLTGKTYVIAHMGKALLVFGNEEKIEKYYPLNPLLFRQPEGICFNSGGDLFISNEARGKRASLLRFSYKQ